MRRSARFYIRLTSISLIQASDGFDKLQYSVSMYHDHGDLVCPSSISHCFFIVCSHVFLGRHDLMQLSTSTSLHFLIQSSLHSNWPNQRNRLVLKSCSRLGTCSLSSNTSDLTCWIWSEVTLQIHLIMTLSLRCNRASEDYVRAKHSLPYSITLLTQLLYILPIVMSGIDHEVSTGNSS